LHHLTSVHGGVSPIVPVADPKSQRRFVLLWYRTIQSHGLIWQVIFGVLKDADKMRSYRTCVLGNQDVEMMEKFSNLER